LKTKIGKIILIVILFVWLFVIFSFSRMSGSESNQKSKGTIDKVLTQAANITNKLNITDVNTESAKKIPIIEQLNTPLRKCMHAGIYFVLSILMFIVLKSFDVKTWKAFLVSVILAFFYACSDEYHQTLVEGRTGQFSDVIIDMIVGFLGAFFATIVLFIKNKLANIKQQKKLKKKMKNLFEINNKRSEA